MNIAKKVYRALASDFSSALIMNFEEMARSYVFFLVYVTFMLMREIPFV